MAQYITVRDLTKHHGTLMYSTQLVNTLQIALVTFKTHLFPISRLVPSALVPG